MDENALKYTFLIVFTIKTMYTYISHIKKKKNLPMKIQQMGDFEIL